MATIKLYSGGRCVRTIRGIRPNQIEYNGVKVIRKPKGGYELSRMGHGEGSLTILTGNNESIEITWHGNFLIDWN